MTAPALELHEVCKTFNPGQWNEVEAVRNVTLKLEGGESVLIVGENGSGKSTLLNLIDGTVELTSGSIRIKGFDVSTWPTYRRFQFFYRVHQDSSHGMAPYGTVAENLAVLALQNKDQFKLGKLFDLKGKSLFEKTIADINPDLATKLDHKIFQLSPGQRQSVALAMLAMYDGKQRILLADEPTAALDPPTAEICLNQINQKAVNGWLVLHVTHNQTIIDAHKGRIITMSEGKVASNVTK